jgi:hypothetical protein
LPQIRELLLLRYTPIPDTETMRCLTGLETIWAAWVQGPTLLETSSILYSTLRDLAIHRFMLTTKSVSELERFIEMRHLYLDGADTVKPLAAMQRLERLHAHAARGWTALASCEALQEVTAQEAQIANLRAFKRWTRLRELTLTGRGVKSLAGLEAFEQLETLALLNFRLDDLSPLRQLAHLQSLLMRMPARGIDLESVAAVPHLRSLVIDDGEFRLPTIRALAAAPALEELTLEPAVDDGNLIPLAEIRTLRKVRLGVIKDAALRDSAEALRRARPDVQVQFDYVAPDPKYEKLKERVGEITIRRPGEGLEQWSIFESLAERLDLQTNPAAEARLKRELKKRDPELLKRLEWDTEGGNVGVYADSEDDIRVVAQAANELIAAAKVKT